MVRPKGWTFFAHFNSLQVLLYVEHFVDLGHHVAFCVFYQYLKLWLDFRLNFRDGANFRDLFIGEMEAGLHHAFAGLLEADGSGLSRRCNPGREC